MRSILVQAGLDPGMTARLETGLDLARAHDSHITMLIDTPLGRFIATDGLAGGAIVATDAMQDALAADDVLAETVREQLISQDVPFDVVRFECEPVEAFVQAARLADLVVVSRDCGYVGELALGTRIPILALTSDAAFPTSLASVSVARDGSDASASALRHAVPLLKAAARVQVLTVTKPGEDFPATDALRYLARHGVKADLVELVRKGPVEEALLKAATECSTDLLVMGAYGHSPLREALFGGVTRFFLNEPTAPALLLAH